MEAYPRVAGRSLRRTIFHLAWPVILANFLQTLATTVDILLVGHLPEGEVAIDAVGLGGQIYFVAYSAVFAISTGTIALVARATGAGDRREANHALKVSFALGLLLSLPMALGGVLFAREFVGLFGAAPEVVGEGTAYTSILFYSIPFLFINVLGTAALRGAGDTRTPLYVGGLVNVANAAINYNLIYGRLGLPALGVPGAALGTTIAYGLGAAAFLLFFLRRGAFLSLREPTERGPLDLPMAHRILRLGAPAAVEQVLLQVGFTVWIVFVAGFGTTALAAHLVGMRVNALAFMPGFGYSVAATALVGQNLGAERPGSAEASALESVKLAVATMVGLALAFALFAEPILSLFTPDADVIALGALWIRIYALGMPAFGIFFTVDGALRGAGDIVGPVATSTGGLLLIRLPLSFLLGDLLFHSLLWVWIPMVIEYYVRSLVIYLRFASGRWKTARV